MYLCILHRNQDGHQNGGKQVLADDSVYTLQVKTFVEIARIISELLKIFFFTIKKNCGVK